MLGDALRWSNLANGSLQSPWLTEVFDAALVILQNNANNIATHEAALTAVLRFFCSFLRWASEGPEVVQNAKPLWGEGRIGMLITALLQLMGRCADNPKVSTVGGIAEVIRPMLMGPMEYEAKENLKKGFQQLNPPLKQNPMDAHKLVEKMAIAKVDQKRFHKVLYDVAEQFHMAMKRSGQ